MREWDRRRSFPVRRRRYTIVAFSIMVVLVLVSLFYYATASSACDAKHGVLVRGPFGYVCVASSFVNNRMD